MKKIYILASLIISSLVFGKTKDLNPNQQSLAFTPNVGQIVNENNQLESSIQFKASTRGLEFYVTNTGLSYVFVKHKHDVYDPALGGAPDPNFVHTTDYGRVDMILKNATIDKHRVITEQQTAATTNFYYAHCPNGITGVSSYQKLTYPDVYPNIDWVIYSNANKHLKYEFIVHPGGDPADIKMEYKYADLNVYADSLTFSTPMGKISEQGLYCYVKENNSEVAANYVMIGTDVGINVTAPAGKTLVIDPPLVWSTYWGGAGDEQPQTLVTSQLGEYVFVSGYTSSTTYPTQNPGGGTYFQGTFGGSYDAFVVKFDTSGVLFWSTYYGGTGSEGSTSYTGISLAVGQGNTLWMVGTTNSTNLPLQNAGGGAYYQAANAGLYDYFIVKFDLAGIRQHATYMGGTNDDGGLSHGNGADCDANGNIYFSGRCISTNFPMLNPGGGAFYQTVQQGSDDLCIVKMTSAGVLLWSTLFGGSGDDMNYSMDLHVDRIFNKLYIGTCSNSTNLPCVNPGGSFYFDNTNNGLTDMFLARFTLAGVQDWGTYIGGSNDEWLAMSVSTAPDGDVAMITLTGSTNMPCVNPGGGAFFSNTFAGGGWDVYLCRLETNGVMSWSSYYGTANNEHCQHNLCFDGKGNIIMDCVSDGTAAPPTFNPGPPHFYVGVKDALGTYCLVQFSPTGVMLWGTYWGGSGHDHLFGTVGKCVGVSAHSDIFVTGETTSPDLVMLNPGGGAFFKNVNSGAKEGFVAKFNNDIMMPLPIELLNFSCEPNPNGMNLKWTTANEHNNDHFTIERTTDGQTYEMVATVKGMLNSFQTHHYEYTDMNPPRGNSYYRLSQTDKSGTENTFNVIACTMNGNEDVEVLMNVYTISGQLLFSKRTSNYINELKNTDLTQGIYLVELVNGTETKTIKHVKGI